MTTGPLVRGRFAREAPAVVRPPRGTLSLSLPLPTLGGGAPAPSASASASKAPDTTPSVHSTEVLRRRAESSNQAVVATPHSEPSPRGEGPSSESNLAEDPAVDFANAALYLGGIQTVFATCCCAVVSVLAVWLVPATNVSAVRTLVFCVMTAVVLMRVPLRVGRARGLVAVFTTLQPAVAVYLLCLTIEQLLHTCTSEVGYAPSWRRVIFHGATLVMIAAGLMRARAPLEETDVPFLMASGSLAVVALFPPPAIAFVGPLCQSVTIWEGADRLVRAFVFASLYCIHVYASTPSSNVAPSETLIIITRSTSAVVWVMGAHPLLLLMSVVQGAIVILARLRIESTKLEPPTEKACNYGGSSLASACETPYRVAGMGFSGACAAMRGVLGVTGASSTSISASNGEYIPVPSRSYALDDEDDDLEAGHADVLSPQARAVAAHQFGASPQRASPSPSATDASVAGNDAAAEDAACDELSRYATQPPPPPPPHPHPHPHSHSHPHPHPHPHPLLQPPEAASCAGAGAGAGAGIGPLSFREIGAAVGAPPVAASGAQAMTPERMAEIAATLVDD